MKTIQRDRKDKERNSQISNELDALSFLSGEGSVGFGEPVETEPREEDLRMMD